MDENPKLVNSNIIDCIPQGGKCPLNCQECYYNYHFYRALEPEVPTVEAARGKIVRVNSGHDSNLQFATVMAATLGYPDRFYNTSLPLIRFGAPTVLTINGRDTDKTYYRRSDVKGNIAEIMFVRFRVNTWNLHMCDAAVDDWTLSKVPVVLTDMRYYQPELVKDPQSYDFKKHILNSYYCLRREALNSILARYSHDPLVFWCGNPFSGSTYCEQCRLCELLYWKTKQRMS